MTQISYDANIDLYRILQISPEADADQIKAAYRAAMRKVHPDLNGGKPGSTLAAQRLNHAYDVLSEQSLRTEYDRARKTHSNAEKNTRRKRGRSSVRRRRSRWEAGASVGVAQSEPAEMMDQVFGRIALGLLIGLVRGLE